MRINRIRRTRDFQNVFKKGTKSQGEILSLYIWKGADIEPIAAGVAVSGKFAPSAVKRNYIRRIVNAYFHENSDSLKKGVKIVVKVSRSVKDVKKRTLLKVLKKDLEVLLKGAGALR